MPMSNKEKQNLRNERYQTLQRIAYKLGLFFQQQESNIPVEASQAFFQEDLTEKELEIFSWVRDKFVSRQA